jgi:hypothetical protein
MRETPPGPVVEEDREAQITHLLPTGQRPIRTDGRDSADFGRGGG